MKKFILTLILVFSIFFSTNSNIDSTYKNIEKSKLEFLKITENEIEEFYSKVRNIDFKNFNEYAKFWMMHHPVLKAERKIKREKEIKDFLNLLAFKESSHNWKVVNRFGYIGKYQFGSAVLKDFGLGHINSTKFRRNPNILPEHVQDSLIVDLMESNKRYLEPYLNKYRNKKIKGIVINDASVLAAAHLVGKGSMKKFFETNGKYIRSDGNNVKATDYMREFQKYKFIL